MSTTEKIETNDYSVISTLVENKNESGVMKSSTFILCRFYFLVFLLSTKVKKIDYCINRSNKNEIQEIVVKNDIRRLKK